jgi:hypothetical protein
MKDLSADWPIRSAMESLRMQQHDKSGPAVAPTVEKEVVARGGRGARSTASSKKYSWLNVDQTSQGSDDQMTSWYAEKGDYISARG